MAFLKSDLETNLYTTLWGKNSQEAKWMGEGHVPNFRYAGKVRVLTDYVEINDVFEQDKVILGPLFNQTGAIIHCVGGMKTPAVGVTYIEIGLYSSTDNAQGVMLQTLLNLQSNDYKFYSSTSNMAYHIMDYGMCIGIKNIGSNAINSGKIEFSIIYCI